MYTMKKKKGLMHSLGNIGTMRCVLIWKKLSTNVFFYEIDGG